MAKVLNLTFSAVVPLDKEYDDPLGLGIIRKLQIDLGVLSWSTKEPENWRDCGWSIRCVKEKADLEVIVCVIEPPRWILQVAPTKLPGLVAGMFGSQPSAGPHDVYALAQDVHRCLRLDGVLGEGRWRWDKFPDPQHGSPEPTAA